MRCPKCNQEINPHSERCPNCGTPAKYAVPDGDTMTRVRKNISVIQRENEVSDDYLSDASFFPVLKFDRPGEAQEESVIQHNPAEYFPDESFTPVDLSEMIDTGGDGSDRHRELSESIRRMVSNKDDDLLAEYYFKDGISDLESYQLAESYRKLEEASGNSSDGSVEEHSGEKDSGSEAEEMSEAAKRLSQFPEEKGFDRFLTSMWEKYDSAVVKVKGFFRRNVADRFKKLYDRFDSKTAPFMNRILEKFVYKKTGNTKRMTPERRQEDYRLRKRVWGAVAAVLVLLTAGFFVVNRMMSSEIDGKWIISTDAGGDPNIIMEFKAGGKAMISVKSEDGWHIHKQGRYTTDRKNGHDMLTIMYEDGDIKRLYYSIDGKTGTFINVDTNIQVVYEMQ